MLRVTIVTPFGEVFDGETEQVVAPGYEGEFGVLDEHIPFLTRSQPGVVTLKQGGKDLLFAIGESFIEVSPDRVLVLAESAMSPDQVEKDAVQKDLADAEDRLANSDMTLDDPEVICAQHDIRLAEARLQIL